MAASAANARAADILSRNSTALAAVEAMQAAAHAAALQGANNLGADPNHIGQQLPNVPDGLATGGLVPISGLATSGTATTAGVANPVPTSGANAWVNATTPTQSTPDASGKTTVTVVQTGQQALLTWSQFNVGKKTTLDFNQSAGGSDVGDWVALNQILDPSGVPSQILGQIKAPGQIYVINQNGIIFGGSSQINTHALVASSLPINTNLVQRGLLNNPDVQFLFSQEAIAPGSLGPTAAFTPPAAPVNGEDGDVTVQAGAVLQTTDADGKVILVGPNVSNAGTIDVDSGQVILGAGLQVGFQAHDSNDPSLRGFDTFIGAVSDSGAANPNYAGTVTNNGLIEAPLSDTTLAGAQIGQNGFIDSATSVSLNGRVDLLASYSAISEVSGVAGFSGTTGFYPTATGTVTFGPGSITQILPDLSDPSRVVGASLALPSQVNVQGLAIHLQSNAEILAPDAEMTFDAGQFLPNAGSYSLIYGNGQFYMDAGAGIDAFGSQDVPASVTENIVYAQLLGTEFANEPLQRNGVLRGQTVLVDIGQSGIYNGTVWIGTPLADVSGYANLVEHNVGELTENGGSVTIQAGNSVVTQPGATINVSGGSIAYDGANVQTTLLSSGGNIFNIAQATPDRVYDGIVGGFTVSNAKYGLTQTYLTPLVSGYRYQPSYTQGGDAGTISIAAPSMALDGSYFGTSVAGQRQQFTASQLANTYGNATFLPEIEALTGIPSSGTLSLAFQSQDTNSDKGISPTPPTITFVNGSPGQTPAAAFALDSSGLPLPLGPDRTSQLNISADLVNDDGFGVVKIVNNDGAIHVPADVDLSFAPGGAFAVSAANVDIEGSITAPSGTLAFTVADVSPYDSFIATPPPDFTRGNFTLGAAGTLNVAGLEVDEQMNLNESAQIVNNGGSISVTAFDLNVLSGSSPRTALNVNGGVLVDGRGSITYGQGGAISLLASQDSTITSVVGGKLNWNFEMAQATGYSGSKGGSLSLRVPLIQVGGATLLNGDTVDSGNTLWLDQTDATGNLVEPEFFSQGGFAAFSLMALGEAVTDASGNPTGSYLPATLIVPGERLTPVVEGVVGKLGENGVSLIPMVLPENERAPVNLSFSDPGVKDFYLGAILVRGDFVLGAGSLIQTDPQNSGGGISISANTATILGDLIAPGGTISIKGGSNAAQLFSNGQSASPTVDLGPRSSVSTAGVTVYTPNELGYEEGTVLAGGTINISGDVLAEAGAVLDVSGTTARLDVAPSQASTALPKLGSSPKTLAQVDSNGGSIVLSGAQELFTDATLQGFAGGPSAQAGSLSVSSGIFLSNAIQTPLDPTLEVTQSGRTIPVADYYGAGTAIGQPVVDGGGNVVPEMGYFAISSFNAGGFGSLSLGGTVQFSGPVTVHASQQLTVGTGGVILADAPVTLQAPYVALGLPFQTPLPTSEQIDPFVSGGSPYYFAPTNGSATLNVAGSLISVGDLSLQGIGTANLTAANGDIEGDGYLDIAGTVSLTAGQIYPTTQNNFTITAYDYGNTTGNGTVNIHGSGVRQLPLSVGGQLDIYASNIFQGGVLRAPFGTIDLGSGFTTGGVAPTDVLTGAGVSGATAAASIPSTVNLTLASGSITSVSAVDPSTGQALVLPYGINENGISWIDPAGNNITSAGNGVDALPAKSIQISGTNVADETGAVIDISGGGDLYSYSFVTGTGGTNDILASNTSFAVLPGYGAAYAPYYSASDYANSKLAVGEQVYLNGGGGLAAGIYTLLPARYALLPGAYLVTPQSRTPPYGSVNQPDGSAIVSGYQFNAFNSTRTANPLLAAFEVESPSVVAQAAQYDVLTANQFFSQTSLAAGRSVPRLPADAGQLVLAATQSLTIDGEVDSQSTTGGLGGLVDIASFSPILIDGPNTDFAQVTDSPLVLSSAGLTGFGADSLLIGGYRQIGSSGETVTVTTNSLTVDNSGGVLASPDLILVSNQTLDIAPGAVIEDPASAGATSPELQLQGDGTFLRVSSSSSAQTVRTGVNLADTTPEVIVGADAFIGGSGRGQAGSISLDSTYGTSFADSAVLNADNISLDSGQISLELQLPATAPTTAGLVLSGNALASLQADAQTLSLLSYSSIDVYGSGSIGFATGSGFSVQGFALHAAEIRGFEVNGDPSSVTINAQNVALDNQAGGTSPGPTAGVAGSLTINANTLEVGTGALALDQYAAVYLNADSEVLLQPETKTTEADTSVVDGTGSVAAAGSLTVTTPMIAAAAYANSQAPGNETLAATGGALVLASSDAPPANTTSAIGASLTLAGQSVSAGNSLLFPSGHITLDATTGDVDIAGSLDAKGTAQAFSVVECLSGGSISITSEEGSVNLLAGSALDVSALSGGGNAGTLTIHAPAGNLSFAPGTFQGTPGDGGQAGTFNLDVATADVSNNVNGNDLTGLETALNAGGFSQAQTLRIRGGQVGGITYDDVYLQGSAAETEAIAHSYTLSADRGSIDLMGTIDASGMTGGSIDLEAEGSLILENGAALTVAGQNFDDAGKGGSITLAAGADVNNNFANTALNASSATGPLLTITPGSTIDLSVAADSSNSAALGQQTGTLVLSAPQTSGQTDLQITALGGTITNASSITLEGTQVFVAADGSIDEQESAVLANGQAFTANTAAILSRVYQGNAQATALEAVTGVEPGAEIVNPTGDLTLADSWDLSTYRFGPGVNGSVDGSGAPGILTLRAAGNVIVDFGANLSDGFDISNTSFASSGNPYWTAPLLPAGDTSWSYQIVAGADLSAARLTQVQTSAALASAGTGGSFLLGENAPALPASASTRGSVLDTYFQTVRTGTGDITIATGSDIQILNNVATIYTAGTQASAITGFTAPTFANNTPELPNYGAQYSEEGGNVTLVAQGNIGHYTSTGAADSSLELPTNWLYRQGALNASGQWLSTNTKGNHKIESTSWWIDFSNYLEGVGALGGGNVTMIAGGSINNVDAVVPTNARIPATNADGTPATPNLANLVEFGGGDLVVQAGDDLNGGVYYAERGNGTFSAGDQILTNSTRAALNAYGNRQESINWLPTTFFLGQGNLTVTAGSDLLMGPVVNPFLLPQGINNSFVNDSYFSTYSSTDTVTVDSLTGNVTLKAQTDSNSGSLANWYTNIDIALNGQSIASTNEPWLGSTETGIRAFATVTGLLPPTLVAISDSGNVDVEGTLTLAPASRGNLELLAADSLNGFQINDAGTGLDPDQLLGSSTINFSDANPANIPSPASPYSANSPTSVQTVLNGLNQLFAESGATQNLTLQATQALHARINGNVLHAGDPVPVYLDAQTGDISGFTLFSGKKSQIVAGGNITDIAFYIQNVSASDVTVVAAGQDIIAYDPNSALRLLGTQLGYAYIGENVGALDGSGAGAPNAGDVQISGPGTLEVLAGRNLDLGVGAANANGTAVGITSVGNVRDPYLNSSQGADIIAAAGLGSSAGLDQSELDFTSFNSQYLSPGGSSSTTYLSDLGSVIGLSDSSPDQVYDAFNALPAEEQDALALNIFYLVLRDAGRDHTNGTGTGYAEGFSAISALFPDSAGGGSGAGDISLTSREIKTELGGNIDLLAPAGGVTVGYDIAGNQPLDQGALTVDGGNINIFAENSVNVGTSRIFTLHGGNVIIWSSTGDIDAGNSSKTVQSAPPTRVVINPQSGNVETDLAGLATGGGIGVLETLVGAPPSDVDLIAPVGAVDAGDAGIRVSGNLNIAAARVINAGNIQVGGHSSGVPTASAPNVGGLASAAAAGSSATNSSNNTLSHPQNEVAAQQPDVPSIVTVEVLGYGGGDSE